MKKKIKYKKDVKNRTGLMLFLLFTCFTLCLSVGYAALNSDLKISGEASFRVESDIRITNIELYETTNLAIENYTGKYSKDTITIGTKLTQVNSSISYKVKVQNSGTVAMWIDSIEEEVKNNSNTEYVLEGIGLKELISPGEEKEFIIKIKYKDNITTLPDNTNLDTILKFNFIKPESILAMGKENESNIIFNKIMAKSSIESIEFRPTLDVIDDAIGSWDASYDKNGTVIASYADSDGNGLYELYIGGIGEVNAPSSSSFLFSNFSNLTTIKFNDFFNTSKTRSMAYMFGSCKKLRNIEIGYINTMESKSFLGMFFCCESLEELDLTSFDTSKVTDMSAMFYGCINIRNLNISNFDTSKVINMSTMFYKCYKLQEVELLSFDTTNVTSMSHMFTACQSLAELNLSSFNTKNVKTMENLFNYCSSLIGLNLSNFDTSSVTNLNGLFANCKSLEKLDLSSFVFKDDVVTSNMFGQVPISTLIYVKDDVSKEFILGVRSDLTNIQVKDA